MNTRAQPFSLGGYGSRPSGFEMPAYGSNPVQQNNFRAPPALDFSLFGGQSDVTASGLSSIGGGQPIGGVSPLQAPAIDYGFGGSSLAIGGDQASKGFLDIGGAEKAASGFSLDGYKTGADILSGLYGIYATGQTLKQNNRQLDLSERDLESREDAYARAAYSRDQSRGYTDRNVSYEDSKRG